MGPVTITAPSLSGRTISSQGYQEPGITGFAALAVGQPTVLSRQLRHRYTSVELKIWQTLSDYSGMPRDLCLEQSQGLRLWVSMVTTLL